MRYLVLFALLTLAGCVSQPSVTSWLDPVSAVTITAQTTPLLLARPEKRRTVNGRDYVRLAAIEVNRMGDRRLYLIAVLWSNADLSGKQWRDFENAFTQIELRVDDRPVVLARHPEDVSTLGIGQSPLPLPVPGSRQIFFSIERNQLRAMAESKAVELTPLGEPDAQHRYEERNNGRPSLSDFLSQLPGA